MGGIGGGLTVHAKAGNVSLDPYAEIVQQSFRNSTFYPLATGLSGTLSTAGVQAYGPIASGLSWQSRVAFAHANDQSAFDSYNSFAADIWLPWLVSWGGMRPWTIIPTAGVTTWRYGAPDPFEAAAAFRDGVSDDGVLTNVAIEKKTISFSTNIGDKSLGKLVTNMPATATFTWDLNGLQRRLGAIDINATMGAPPPAAFAIADVDWAILGKLEERAIDKA